MSQQKNIYIHLEFVRGIAALLVLLEHLRAFILVPYSEIKAPSLIEKGFYFLTNFGHQSVMIFFVLSGFLIYNSIDKKIQNNQWSWPSYLIDRLCRLWTVLIPCIILTLLWDSLGKELTQSIYYSGELRELYNSGPTIKNAEASSSIITLLGNIFFLQEIYFYSYGTNGPLWSLSYEFWYYVLFPLLLLFHKTKNKLLSALLIGFIFYFLPTNIIKYFSIWLFGTLALCISKNKKITKLFSSQISLITSTILFTLLMILSRFKVLPFSSYILGLSFSLLLLALINFHWTGKYYEYISKFLSKISFTLYLAHFPFLGFTCSFFYRNEKFNLNEGIVIFSLLFFVCILYSWIIFLLFENKTPKLRKFIRNKTKL